MPEQNYIDKETFHKLVIAVDGQRVEVEKLKLEVARLRELADLNRQEGKQPKAVN
jgi:hypothetical protein